MRNKITQYIVRLLGKNSFSADHHHTKTFIFASLLIWGLCISPTFAQNCEGEWQEFGGGANGIVNALAVFDDGTGSAIYAAGEFTLIGGVTASRIARWDGTEWSPLGAGLDARVTALAVFDNGAGPELYAGGDFSSAGGLSVSRIAKWNGQSWSGVGSGVNDTVNALAVYDDGDGGSLYATGEFTFAGGVSASRIAKWTGSQWRRLGTSGLKSIDDDFLPAEGSALAVYDDGAGPALYIGGSFIGADALQSQNIIKWNGAFRSMPIVGDQVEALTVHDDGTGPALFLAGVFTFPGNQILKWDGDHYSELGAGLSAGGAFARALAMTSVDLATGDRLVVGGDFGTAGGLAVNNIAQWDGQSWEPLGAGLDGFNRPVRALLPIDNGSSVTVLAGGNFTQSGDLNIDRIASWNPCVFSCPADLAAPSGTLNFFDVLAYLTAFNNADPTADLAAPTGTLNFFDVLAYLTAFNAGCP